MRTSVVQSGYAPSSPSQSSPSHLVPSQFGGSQSGPSRFGPSTSIALRLVLSAFASLMVAGLPSGPGESTLARGNEPGVVESEFPPSWHPSDEASVKQQLDAWLSDQSLDASSVQGAWDAYPTSTTGEQDDLLMRLAFAMAAGDSRAAQLIEQCQNSAQPPPVDAAEWLSSPTVAPFQRNNLRLVVARRLVQVGFYDEALAQLEGLDASDVVDPAALFFCRMASHHQLVEADLARAALMRLLENEPALPRRYQQLARLIERDLAGLQDESLDHIARRMRDVSRRLGQGSAGERVQEIEHGVVKSLDDLIKKQEERQRQQQSRQTQSSGGTPGTTPMDDSRPAELKAPGRVAPRDVGHTAAWGDLPPRERAAAMEQVGREFPAHYRELIELYFRELANDDTEAQP